MYSRPSSHSFSVIVLVVMLIFPGVSYPQGRLALSAVVGTYQMKDMKEIQEDIQKDLSQTFPTKIVTEFPMSLQVELGYDFNSKNEELTKGLYLNYAYTKGRVHYGDYSGQVYVDQNVSRFQFGGRLRARLGSGLGFYLKVGANYSKLEFVSVTELNGSGREESTLGLHSIGFSGEPGIFWGKDFGRLGILVDVGFELNFQGKTLLDDNPDAHLLLPGSSESATIDWTGARFGASLIFNLARPAGEYSN